MKMIKPGSIKPGNRIISLDLLRGIAVILMVQQHTGYWFWNSGGSMSSLIGHYPVMITINGLGGLAAPLFIMLAGTGAALSFEAGRKGLAVFKRGLMLIMLGYMLSLLTPAWFSPWSWYVLHLIGFCMCVSPLLRYLPSFILIALVLIMTLATPLLLSVFDLPRYFSNTFMRGSFSTLEIFKLAVCGGNFPVLPWSGLFIAGFVSGRWIYRQSLKNILKLAASLLATGLLLLFIKQGHFSMLNNGFGSRLLMINLYMYPAYPMQFLALSAVSLLSLFLALFTGKHYAIPQSNILVLAGTVSLTIFIVHIITIRNFMVYSGLWQTFSMPVTALLQLAVLAAILVLVKLWSRSGFKYGLEWLMRKYL